MLKITKTELLILYATVVLQSGCMLPMPIDPNAPTDSGSSTSNNSFKFIDSFSLQSGMLSTPNAIAIGAGGTIYAAGVAVDSSTSWHWTVRKSADQGETWSTVDSYQMTANSPATARSIAVDSNGDIYVGGEAANQPNGGTLYGVIRKSSDQGASWTTIDSFIHTPLMSMNCYGVCSITIDYQGTLFAAGSNGHWIIRKSSDHGASWSNVDSYQSSSGHLAVAQAITSDPSGNLYAAGFGTDSANRWQWIVRKSSDQGGSWSVVDSYAAAGDYAFANAIIADTSGNIYVTGLSGHFQAGTFYPPSQWVVRKGTLNGSSWSTVDSPADVSTGNAANALAIDNSGNVYAIGKIANYWTIRKSTDDGASWKTLDKIWGDGTSVQISNDRMFVGGQASRDSQAIHWILRARDL